MLEIKGFICANSLADNASGKVAPFGELSDYGRTYARDTRTYIGDGAADVEAVVFTSIDNGIDTDLPDFSTSDMNRMGELVVMLIKDGQVPTDKQEFSTTLADQLNEYGVTNVIVLDIVTIDNVTGPTAIQWTAHGVQYTFWFNDTEFLNVDTHFNIEVIPPVANIDDLLRPRSEVIDIVRTSVDVTLEAENIRGLNVNTAFRLFNFTWRESGNSTSIIESMPWGANINGRGGLSIDEQKRAIAAYILENSAYDNAKWSAVFPDIFTPNEIYYIPAWDNISIENKTLFSGTYSPILTVKRQTEMAVKYAIGYPQEHILENVSFTGMMYRSLAMLTIGSPSNIDDVFNIKDQHPTFALMRSTHTDFGRMAPETQAFAAELYELVILAERYTLGVVLESKYTVVVRGGYRYLTVTIDELTIMLLTKESYMFAEGYDWKPNTVEYLVSDDLRNDEVGSVDILDSHVTAVGDATISGSTYLVTAGAPVRLTFTDGSNIIAIDNVVTDIAGRWTASNVDLSTLQRGNIATTATTSDKFGNPLVSSSTVVFAIAAGSFVSIIPTITNDKLDLFARMENEVKNNLITYHITDESNNERSGSTRSNNDGEISVSDIALTGDDAFAYGDLQVLVRGIDLMGVTFEGRSRVAFIGPAGWFDVLSVRPKYDGGSVVGIIVNGHATNARVNDDVLIRVKTSTTDDSFTTKLESDGTLTYENTTPPGPGAVEVSVSFTDLSTTLITVQNQFLNDEFVD